MMVLRSSYFVVRRMLRWNVAFAILMGLPIVLITILGIVAGDAIDSNLGVPVMDSIAFTMVLAFQLFGGSYTMELIKQDLFSERKWRMHALPGSIQGYAFSVVVSCTLFSALQGFLLVLFTQWVYGVFWGNLGTIFVMLLGISLLSQLVCLVIVMSVKEYSMAERLSEVYGLGSIAIAGIWFRIPERLLDIWLINFLHSYGNPVSLGMNIVYGFISPAVDVQRAYLSLGILFAAIAVLALVAMYAGRRKLA
ncbi:ABC transporter permease [Dethiobacter alkaliphilus]|uniref:ABC transporter permease n=1 Tax=Dethiobacter alkaliphilus TaxID=427926 RepID=UPI002226EFE8|nr:ABC transporter permease [Dethiobacter alkaliphilus]MCW3490183.1 ABC transporter permease [Dethiobacter alkaliphilus]